MFTLHRETALGRRGEIQTDHGIIETPCFMPVGTAGAMKGITHDELLMLGADMLLCNTYHLHLQPGEEIVREAGGLHTFIGWEKPILTDSGGFQVFSLRHMSTIDDTKVEFRSHINGDLHTLDPEIAMRIQHDLGADIIMCFDHCPPSTAPRLEIEKAVDRTIRWAAECKAWHEKLKLENGRRTLLFCVIQGGLERDLRMKCTEELIAIGFDGYAIGGLAVGESESEMFSVLDMVCPLLPKDHPRYLMGVGEIPQMRQAIARGIDLFDCVLPMRLARHGTLLLSDGQTIRVSKNEFRHRHDVIDAASPSTLSRRHTLSYLHHLFKAKERLYDTIACMQNIGVTIAAVRGLRTEINAGLEHAL